MRFSPVLIFHISVGIVGILSGAAAMTFRKGSARHRMSGNVFVVAMLCLAASGAYIGFRKHQTLNAAMGILTFYLVTTAWMTGRHRDGRTSLFDWSALLVPLAVATGLAAYGVKAANSPTGAIDGYPAVAYFVFGSLALLFAAGDVRMLALGGLSGARRIKRHLRRMCVGFFIATGSFFLGQQQVFPAVVRSSNVLFLPAFLPLLLMIFWLLRMRFARTYKGTSVPAGKIYSLRTEHH